MNPSPSDMAAASETPVKLDPLGATPPGPQTLAGFCGLNEAEGAQHLAEVIADPSDVPFAGPYHLRPGAPQRRVVCAALKYGPILVVGPRHFDPVMRAQMEVYKAAMKHPDMAQMRFGLATQGFIDQWGTFMDRPEAFQVARAAGQILYTEGLPTDWLDSSHLY